MLTVEKSAIKVSLDIQPPPLGLELEIVQKNLATKIIAAQAQTASLARENPNVILEVVRETMEEMFAQLPEQVPEINQTIAAALEGLIQGIIRPKRSAIAELDKQIQVLQAQKELEQQKLQSQIYSVFKVVEDTGKTQSASIRTAIELAIKAIEEKKSTQQLSLQVVNP